MSKTGKLTPTVKELRIIAGTNAPRFLNFIQSTGTGYGNRYRNGMYTPNRGPERRVVQAFVYPGYVKSKSANDIALLRLDRPLPMFPYAKINAVCLPSPGEEIPGPVATASGWGQTVEKGRQSFYLKSVNVSVVPDE